MFIFWKAFFTYLTLPSLPQYCVLFSKFIYDAFRLKQFLINLAQQLGFLLNLSFSAVRIVPAVSLITCAFLEESSTSPPYEVDNQDMQLFFFLIQQYIPCLNNYLSNFFPLSFSLYRNTFSLWMHAIIAIYCSMVISLKPSGILKGFCTTEKSVGNYTISQRQPL